MVESNETGSRAGATTALMVDSTGANERLAARRRGGGLAQQQRTAELLCAALGRNGGKEWGETGVLEGKATQLTSSTGGLGPERPVVALWMHMRP